MTEILQAISSLASIGFGITAMILLLDIHPKTMPKAKAWLFCLGLLAILIANFSMVQTIGIQEHSKYYMLLVHLPLGILFWLTTKIQPIKLVFTLFTAVFLIFPANLISNLIGRFSENQFGYPSAISFFAALIVLLVLLNKFYKKDFHYLVQHYNSKSFLKLFFLPLIYNIAIYWVGKYSYAISTPIENLVLRSLLFALTFAAYLLVLDISRTDREKQSLKHQQAILSLQLESANQQMNFLRTTQKQATIYRHDLRHHFTILSNFTNEANLGKVQEYLTHTITNMETITPTTYCENETINLIISSFDTVAKQKEVSLCVEARLPQKLAINDTELCSLFANALENAITAAAQITDEKLRKVYLRTLISNNQLLISTENAYVGKLEMEGELPKSQNKDSSHGFGIKSIVAIVEKHNGLYSFETTDGVFVLQMLLPLKTPASK